MAKAIGNNLPRIKVSNQYAIKKTVYKFGPISRIDVAEKLGLTLPTITTNVSLMLSKGFLKEVENDSGIKSLGRHTMLIDINKDARFFIGIEMRGTLRRVVLTNLRGEVIAKASDDEMLSDYDSTIASCAKLTKQVLIDSGKGFDSIAAIGLCSPGLVDSEKGLLTIHPAYRWVNKNLKEDFANACGYKGDVYVENNAIARAYGLALFLPEMLKNSNSLAYMFVSTGIACPMLNDMKNHFGTVSGEGEVGHMVMNHNGPLCRCGNNGCLEAYSSERVMIAKAQQALEEGKAPILAAIVGDRSPLMEDILEAHKKEDPACVEIIDETIEYLGLAIANIDNFVRPECVAIECKLFDEERNKDALMNVVHKNLYRGTFNEYKFSFIKTDEFSGAKGAAAVAVKNNLKVYME